MLLSGNDNGAQPSQMPSVQPTLQGTPSTPPATNAPMTPSPSAGIPSASPTKNVSEAEYARRRNAILLVNLDHRLSDYYDAEDLVYISDGISANVVRARSNEAQMNRTALEAANRMFTAAQRDGLNGFVITTAYRTYAFQHTLYMQEDQPVNEAGLYSVVPPFASEHRTGLAMDITNEQLVNSSDTLTDRFGDSAQGRWIAEHCWEYGFIIRYPVGKSEITRIIFEPWHLRYVGVEHAMAMRDTGECLEEYLGYAG